MNNANDKKTRKSGTIEPNAKKETSPSNTVSNVSPATHQNTPKASVGTQGAHDDVAKAPEHKAPENTNAGASATKQLHGLRVAILATDGIARRPVVVTQADGSESIAIHSTGIIGVSWDHRAVDGAYVSSFLARASELLVGRDWSDEL